jgi:hypothetical protein
MFAWFVPPIVIPAAIVAYFVALVLYRHFDNSANANYVVVRQTPFPVSLAERCGGPHFLRCTNFCYG